MVSDVVRIAGHGEALYSSSTQHTTQADGVSTSFSIDLLLLARGERGPASLNEFGVRGIV